MFSPRWILFIFVSVTCVLGFRDAVDTLRENITSTEWNEDLEPVIEAVTKRLRKKLIPIAQEILYDENIPTECTQSLARIASGINDRRLWALRCEFSNFGMLTNSWAAKIAIISKDLNLSQSWTRAPDPHQVKLAFVHITTDHTTNVLRFEFRTEMILKRFESREISDASSELALDEYA